MGEYLYLDDYAIGEKMSFTIKVIDDNLLQLEGLVLTVF
jgi:hypothetical protein